MGSLTIWHWLIVLMIVVLIFGTGRAMGNDGNWLPRYSRLRKESGHMPVHSAETTDGEEAEFIRDRLPERFPAALILVASVILGAAVWWFTR
ncbi:MAG TPA: hypothetical protein VMH77_01215 [Steroidobacteraceae bacterium]|nr:hypothetical protein [Steroidobacteraceae bacterium]